MSDEIFDRILIIEKRLYPRLTDEYQEARAKNIAATMESDFISKKFGERNRRIFLARLRDGETYKEISIKTGISPQRVAQIFTKIFRYINSKITEQDFPD